VLHRGALGQLELDRPERGPGARQHAGDGRHRVRVLQGASGHVDGHGQLEAQLGPAAPLPAGLGQHLEVDLDDQARPLGQGDEGVGGEQPPDRVGPADQGLGPDQPARGQLDLGLVADPELAAGHGQMQVGLQAELLGRLDMELGGVAVGGRAAAPFGLVHGGVGVAEELVGLGPVGGEDGQADAGGDEQGLAVQPERLREGVADPGRGLGGQVLALQVGEQHGELVPAQAGHGVGGADGGRQPARLLEQGVAGGMAELVPDLVGEAGPLEGGGAVVGQPVEALGEVGVERRQGPPGQPHGHHHPQQLVVGDQRGHHRPGAPPRPARVSRTKGSALARS
jgi:hypothetical protein